MFTVEITSIPASSSSSTSCQRFSLREPGTLVCASSSTSATVGLARRGPRRRPSPRTSAPRYSIDRRGTTSRSPIASAVRGRPWVSTKPTTTSVPRSCAAPALVEHGERLADARRRAEVDAELTASHRRDAKAATSASEREVQLQHVDAGLAEEAERRVVGVVVDELTHLLHRDAARPRRRAAPGTPALATEMWGSSPEPDAVTASTGTGSFACEPVRRRGRPRRAASPCLMSSGFVGPRFEPPLACAS